jgi:nucleoprotein TPR
MATATYDSGYLSAYLDIPRATLDTLIDAPTAELVRGLIEAVALKARQNEELQAEKLRLEVELENAVRSSESRSQALKATVDKALQEVNVLREKLSSEGTQFNTPTIYHPTNIGARRKCTCVSRK